MKVNGFRVEFPYESENWQRLGAGSEAQKRINVGVAFLHALALMDYRLICFKIWFWAPNPQWDRDCGSVFNWCVDEHWATHDQRPVRDTGAPDQALEDDRCSGEVTDDDEALEDEVGSDGEFPESTSAAENNPCSEEGEIVGQEESTKPGGKPEDDPWAKRWGTGASDALEKTPWDDW